MNLSWSVEPNHPHDMAKYETCFRCGGTNLEPGKLVANSSESGPITFLADLARLFSSGLRVEAYFCRDCGSIELVADPEKAKTHLFPNRQSQSNEPDPGNRPPFAGDQIA
jgi:hypothetical protein